MEAIAAGDYARRVGESATEELGELVDSFNAMAPTSNPHAPWRSSPRAQLSEANTAFRPAAPNSKPSSRPSPTASSRSPPQGQIVVANRAFSELLDPGGQKHFVGMSLANIFTPEITEYT